MLYLWCDEHKNIYLINKFLFQTNVSKKRDMATYLPKYVLHMGKQYIVEDLVNRQPKAMLLSILLLCVGAGEGNNIMYTTAFVMVHGRL